MTLEMFTEHSRKVAKAGKTEYPIITTRNTPEIIANFAILGPQSSLTQIERNMMKLCEEDWNRGEAIMEELWRKGEPYCLVTYCLSPCSWSIATQINSINSLNMLSWGWHQMYRHGH
jgi:hypothetical protein